MSLYQQRIVRGYLDKSPEYQIPLRDPQVMVQGMKSLKPSIQNMELHRHRHPNGIELAVIIRGENLWFCNRIEIESLGPSGNSLLEADINCNNVFNKIIRYTHSDDKDSPLGQITAENDLMVTVHSHFAAPIRKKKVPVSYLVSYIMLYNTCIIILTLGTSSYIITTKPISMFKSKSSY